MKIGNFALEIPALHEKEPLLLVKLRLLFFKYFLYVHM